MVNGVGEAKSPPARRGSGLGAVGTANLLYFSSFIFKKPPPPPFCVCRSVESTCSKGED